MGSSTLLTKRWYLSRFPTILGRGALDARAQIGGFTMSAFFGLGGFIAFAVLIIILLFRPAGLLGKFTVEKV